MEVFDDFRSVYLLILAGVIIYTIMILFQKETVRLINGFGVLSFSLILLIISDLLFIQLGYIVDRHNYGGDTVSFYLVVAINILCILNILLFLWKKEKGKRA